MPCQRRIHLVYHYLGISHSIDPYLDLSYFAFFYCSTYIVFHIPEKCRGGLAQRMSTYFIILTITKSDSILTIELVQGKNIPELNSPSKGPPIMPNILRAACKNKHMNNIENNIPSDIRLSRNVWSTRDLKDHDVSCAAATFRQVIKYIVSKCVLYSTDVIGGQIIRSIIRTITDKTYMNNSSNKNT